MDIDSPEETAFEQPPSGVQPVGGSRGDRQPSTAAVRLHDVFVDRPQAGDGDLLDHLARTFLNDEHHIDHAVDCANVLARLERRRWRTPRGDIAPAAGFARLDVPGAVKRGFIERPLRRAGRQAGRLLAPSNAHAAQDETAVPAFTVTGTEASVSSKTGAPTTADACGYPRARRAARTARSYSGGLVNACSADDRPVRPADRTADDSPTPSSRTSIRRARGPGVTSMTRVRTDSSPSMRISSDRLDRRPAARARGGRCRPLRRSGIHRTPTASTRSGSHEHVVGRASCR